MDPRMDMRVEWVLSPTALKVASTGQHVTQHLDLIEKALLFN